MLSKLRHKFLVGQIAVFALMFNAMMQVECCVEAFASDSGYIAEARASLCLTDGEGEGAAERMAAFEVWAEAVVPGSFKTGSGHHDHSSSDCDCTDSNCGQGGAALHTVQQVYEYSHQIGQVWPPRDILFVMYLDGGAFSARGPPDILL